MFVSLDGFVSSGTDNEDWIFRSGDDATDAWVVAQLDQAGLIAMGSRSFGDMAQYWPTAESPFAAVMNATPKLVFSRSRPAAPDADGSWANPFVASGELTETVAHWKAQHGGDIRVLGGAQFAQALAASGLVDEFQLMICPVALGSGVALFAGLPRPLDLQLVSAQQFNGGAMALVYRPAA
ncbi:dihydrofolate reductase family protein [Sandarakinorhabdus limnophila]|jgi:dihydrofolate reductase|uniref:dihydrofolate reductase family protein n=1 Tax=Sandarakinorhabdus limnophila TaxID=210512 RepID=UPI0023551AA6|nr:dihydrofolate reductase family protein [Sandarakinorhabdus limnophila]